MSTQTKPKYTLEDAGCYVDGARGIYATSRILAIAMQHGYQTPPTQAELDEFPNEVEDEIDVWFNTTFPVDGAYWGRSEQGDWGLWATEEQE